MEELATISVTITKEDFEYLLKHKNDNGIIEHIVILTSQCSEEAKQMLENS
jgi:hypothetical protein